MNTINPNKYYPEYNSSIPAQEDLGLGSIPPSCPTSTFIRINIPAQNIQKCLKYFDGERVLDLKNRLISSLHQPLEDELNFGLYLPPGNGHIGGFLNEHITMTRCNFSNSIGYLELRYKRRVYRDAKTNIKQLKEANTVQKQKQFLNYVKKGNVAKVKRMCDKGLDPNFHDTVTGESPLSLATEVLDPSDLLESLVKGGAHVDFRNKWDGGLTALHVASRLGKAISIQKLLSLGATTSNGDVDSLTPLYHYLMSGHGANDALCAKLLIIDGNSPVGIKDHTQWQEIHQVCRFGHIKILAMLIQRTSDIEAKNECGNTPLHICSLYNQLECCKYLLRCGANPQSKNLANQSPADVAVISGHQGLAAFLRFITCSGTRLGDTVPPIIAPPQNTKSIYGTMPRNGIHFLTKPPSHCEIPSFDNSNADDTPFYGTISGKVVHRRRRPLAPEYRQVSPTDSTSATIDPQMSPSIYSGDQPESGIGLDEELNAEEMALDGALGDKGAMICESDRRENTETTKNRPFDYTSHDPGNKFSEDQNSSSTTSGKGSSLNSDDLTSSGNQSPPCAADDTSFPKCVATQNVEIYDNHQPSPSLSSTQHSSLTSVKDMMKNANPRHPPPPVSVMARCEIPLYSCDGSFNDCKNVPVNIQPYQESYGSSADANSQSQFVQRVVILQTGPNGYGFVLAGPKVTKEIEGCKRWPHVILSIEDSSPAYQSGLKPGDHLIEVNGAVIESLNHGAVSALIASSSGFLKMIVLTLTNGSLHMDQQIINATPNHDSCGEVSLTDPLSHLRYVQNRFGSNPLNLNNIDVTKSLPGRLKSKPFTKPAHLIFNSLAGIRAPNTPKRNSTTQLTTSLSIPERLNALFNSHVPMKESTLAQTDAGHDDTLKGHILGRLHHSKSYTDGLNMNESQISWGGTINSRITRKFSKMDINSAEKVEELHYANDDLNLATDSKSNTDKSSEIQRVASISSFYNWKRNSAICLTDLLLENHGQVQMPQIDPNVVKQLRPAPASYSKMPDRYKRRMRNTLSTNSFSHWSSSSNLPINLDSDPTFTLPKIECSNHLTIANPLIVRESGASSQCLVQKLDDIHVIAQSGFDQSRSNEYNSVADNDGGIKNLPEKLRLNLREYHVTDMGEKTNQEASYSGGIEDQYRIRCNPINSSTAYGQQPPNPILRNKFDIRRRSECGKAVSFSTPNHTKLLIRSHGENGNLPQPNHLTSDSQDNIDSAAYYHYHPTRRLINPPGGILYNTPQNDYYYRQPSQYPSTMYHQPEPSTYHIGTSVINNHGVSMDGSNSYIPPPPRYLAPVPPMYYRNHEVEEEGERSKYYGNMNSNNNNSNAIDNIGLVEESIQEGDSEKGGTEEVEQRLAQAAINKEINERINRNQDVEGVRGPVGGMEGGGDECISKPTIVQNSVEANLEAIGGRKDKNLMNSIKSDNHDLPPVIEACRHNALMHEIRSFFTKQSLTSAATERKPLKQAVTEITVKAVPHNSTTREKGEEFDHLEVVEDYQSKPTDLSLLTSLKQRVDHYLLSPNTFTSPAKSTGDSSFLSKDDDDSFAVEQSQSIFHKITVDSESLKDDDINNNNREENEQTILISCNEVDVKLEMSGNDGFCMNENRRELKFGDTFTKITMQQKDALINCTNESSDCDIGSEYSAFVTSNSNPNKCRISFNEPRPEHENIKFVDEGGDSPDDCESYHRELLPLKITHLTKGIISAQKSFKYSTDSLECRTTDADPILTCGDLLPKKLAKSSANEAGVPSDLKVRKTSKETQTMDQPLQTSLKESTHSYDNSSITLSHRSNLSEDAVMVKFPSSNNYDRISDDFSEIYQNRSIHTRTNNDDHSLASLLPSLTTYDSSTFVIEQVRRPRAPILTKQRSTDESFDTTTCYPNKLAPSLSLNDRKCYASMDPLLNDQRLTSMTINGQAVAGHRDQRIPVPPVRNCSKYLVKRHINSMKTPSTPTTNQAYKKSNPPTRSYHLDKDGMTTEDSIHPRDICRRYIFASDRSSIRPLTVYSASDLAVTEREWSSANSATNGRDGGRLTRVRSVYGRGMLNSRDRWFESPFREGSDANDSRSKTLASCRGNLSRKAIVSNQYQVPSWDGISYYNESPVRYTSDRLNTDLADITF